jgi:RNA polymerase sigma-70 factor (ECF subfamily)
MQNKIEPLIISCKKGNQTAQIQVYDTYCNAMFSIACRYLKNEEDAKDAMQDGFLKAFLNIENYKPTATFGAWLKRIIINQCIDTLKKKHLQFEDIETDNLQIAEDDNWDFDIQITKAQITNAIETLENKYKLVVQLYLLEGYDHEEISEILDIPIKTSRTQLHRAKLQLQDLLKTKCNEARY